MFFIKKSLNQIILINISLFLILKIVIYFSLFNSRYIIGLLSLNSSSYVYLTFPHMFFTYGFFHSDFSHIFSNFLVLFLYYTILYKLDNKTVWYVYILSNFIAGVVWIIYVYFFDNSISYLLGSSCGIISLVSYATIKYYDYVLLNIVNIHIRIQYLLYAFVIMFITNFIEGYNKGGEITHFVGVVVGLLYYVYKDLKYYQNQ